MQMEFDTSTQSGKEQAIAAYKSELAANHKLSLKAFCDRHGIVEYKKLLWWCNGQGISIYALQGRNGYGSQDPAQYRGNEQHNGNGTFIQFSPAHRPSSCDLRGISITFPDGVNLTLQESSVESVICLLAVYQSRQGGAKSCSD